MPKEGKKNRNMDVDASLLEEFDRIQRSYDYLSKSDAYAVALMMFIMSSPKQREHFIDLLAVSERRVMGGKTLWQALSEYADDQDSRYALRQLLLKPPKPPGNNRGNEKKG